MHLRKRMLAMTAVVFMAVFAMLAGNIPMEDTGEKNVPDFIDDHKKTIYFGYSDDSLTSYINSAAVAFGEREDVHVIPVLLDDNSYLETINNMMIELYASMAQAEMEKKEKRQREGIAAKKARGEWADYGRPRAMDLQEFAKQYQAVERGEKKPFELMRELGMTKATFYRYKGQLKKEG